MNRFKKRRYGHIIKNLLSCKIQQKRIIKKIKLLGALFCKRLSVAQYCYASKLV